MKMSESLLSKKSVCVITGPTKGLGWSIAKNLSVTLPEGSLFILLSRNEGLLEKIAGEIASQKRVNAVYEVFDQGSTDQDAVDTLLQKCLAKAGQDTALSSFEQAILVNNAGSIEPLDFAKNLDNLDIMSEFMQLNLVGFCVLTAKFLQVFTSPLIRTVINISSLAAISPMKSWSLYCMVKAARDMQMKVIGAEEENIRTLSYAPGPLRTDMSETAGAATKDATLKNWIVDGLKEKTFLECDETVSKLLKVLSENTFENGAHIDYYDVENVSIDQDNNNLDRYFMNLNH